MEMNGARARPQRILLLTANVGSLFEEQQRLQESWLEVITERLLSEDADFVVLHMQETGGKNFAKCSAQVPVLINRLADALAERYATCRAFLDLDFSSTSSYTALGSVFFLHRELASVNVEQFDFASAEYVPVTIDDTREFRTDSLEADTRVIKRKFPKQFWPALKWGRKGYLLTRWRIDGKPLEFVNVHLFHDDSNLALHENPSLYSSNRKRALNFVIEQCGNEDLPRYFFGDFNFRLDPSTFLNKLTERAEAHEMEDTIHGSQDFLKEADARDGRNLLAAGDLRRAVSAIEFRPVDGSDAENCILRIEKKRFDYFNHGRLHDWQSYREDDKEAQEFALHEQPIFFPPTYPWSEDPLQSNVFMKTRAPAWCDRVLLNDAAHRALDASRAVYESIGRAHCMGDHKPVLLAFDIE